MRSSHNCSVILAPTKMFGLFCFVLNSWMEQSKGPCGRMMSFTLRMIPISPPSHGWLLICLHLFQVSECNC